MGRKGVSKRKPKQSNSGTNDNVNRGSSHARSGESPSVQLLVKEKGFPFDRSNTNPSNGSNKKNRKGK